MNENDNPDVPRREIDNPHVRYLVSLLVMLPRDGQHALWRSLDDDQEHLHDVHEQIRPLVSVLVGGGSVADSLAAEVLDGFANPSEATRELIGGQLGGPAKWLDARVRLADVWLGELLAAALRVRAEGTSQWLDGTVDAWCAGS